MGNTIINESDMIRANKLGRKLELVIIIILTICYVLQGSKNSISTIGLIAILLTLWVPVIISYFIYKKNPGSGLIKHCIGIGYGLFFLVVCLISDQQLVFTYAFPMLVLVGIYCDFKFSLIVASLQLVVAIAHSVFFTINANFAPQAVAAMEIEIAAAALVGFYVVLANKFIIEMNGRRVQEIDEANKKTEEMLSQIVSVSNQLAEEVELVSNKMLELEESSQETKAAMAEVQSGTQDAADSVQTQLVKTEEIQNQIDKVTGATENIGTQVSEALVAIKEGRDNINNLIKQAEVSERAGNGAVVEVEELKKSTAQMESIVSLIQEVASQTSLLSLNASIEAARAGEAGRGFAVVASEISNLAAQTQTATEKISSLIENVTKEMENVAGAITSLVESNKIQNESAQVTAGSFEKIDASTMGIKDQSTVLSGIVGTLDSANKEIVESIQTISAITEEVTAHSATTSDKTDRNEEIVTDVKDVVEEMMTHANKLKEIE